MRAVVLAFLLVLPVMVLAVPPAEAATVNVSVSNFSFSPAAVELDPGDTVQWNWVSGTHSVVQDGGTVWCGTRSSGSCSKTFPDVGSYSYFCSIHPGSMRGTINVLGPAPTITIAAPADGTDVSGVFTVSGTATGANGVAKVDVRIAGGPWLLASGTDSWSRDIDSSFISNGAKTVEARVIAGDGQDATASITVNVANTEVRDLDLQAVRGTTGTTAPPTLTFTLVNRGTVDLDSVVRLAYHYKGEWHTIQDVAVSSSAFSTLTRQVSWSDPFLVGRFDIRATVDPNGQIAEINEGNNVKTHTAAFYTPIVAGLDVRDP